MRKTVTRHKYDKKNPSHYFAAAPRRGGPIYEIAMHCWNMLKPFVPIKKMKIPVELSMIDEPKKNKLVNHALELLSSILTVLLLYLIAVIITGGKV